AVATYGRGLWILDDLAPLRQIDARVAQGNYLFKPSTAMRVRFDNWTDTPLPAYTPAGGNPPEGPILYHYLKSPATEVALEIRDAHGTTVRRFTNHVPPPDNIPRNVPEYWFAPPEVLPSGAGLNRFNWNLEWTHPDTLSYSFRGRPLDYVEYTLPDHTL